MAKQMFGLLEAQLSNVKFKSLRIKARINHFLWKYWVPFKCWFPAAKVFLKFWRIPFAVEDLQEAVDHGHQGLKEASKDLSEKTREIKLLIERLVELKYHTEKKPAGMSDDDFYKQCYREIFIRYADNYDEDREDAIVYCSIGGVSIPDKYLTRDEEVASFELGFEWSREAMCGCHETYHDELLFLANDLKERGFYDNEI